jgi:hypothetical protein
MYFGYGYRDAESFDLEKFAAVTAAYLNHSLFASNIT